MTRITFQKGSPQTFRYLAITGLILSLVACDKTNDQPPEVIVFDNTIEWGWPLTDSYGGNSFYWWHRSYESGVTEFGDMSTSSWRSPNNFENGNFHLRFQVIEQPTANAFTVQFGIWQDLNKDDGGSETVSSRYKVDGGPGTYVEADLESPSTWWQKRTDSPVDYRRPEDFHRIGIVLWKHDPVCLPMAQGWSNSNQCPDPENEALNFFPMTAKVTVVAVADGHTFSGWENYP